MTTAPATTTPDQATAADIAFTSDHYYEQVCAIAEQLGDILPHADYEAWVKRVTLTIEINLGLMTSCPPGS